MSDKPIVLIGYALLGIMLALGPFALRSLDSNAQGAARTPTPVTDLAERWASLIGLGFGLSALYWSHSLASPALACIAVVFALLFVLRNGRIDLNEAIGSGVALVIAATLPWWDRDKAGLLEMEWTSLPVFFLACFFVCRALRQLASRPKTAGTAAQGVLAVCFVSIAAAICFGTGILPSNAIEGMTVGDAAWHHWGAYVGPSEMVLAGARLFHDMPAQYGLGPTLLIAALCIDSCWTAFYWIAGFSNLAFVVSIAMLAHALRGNGQTLAEKTVVALLCLVCCLLWTAYPVDLRTPVVWPSVGGLRFLPVVALVLLLVWKERNDQERDRHRQPTRWGHFAWAIGALWSPESAFCVTFVWWPYYLWRRCGDTPSGELLPAFARAVLALLLITAGLVGLFLLVYWLAYGTHPTQIGLLAYFLHPPGVMPINRGGPIWFFAAVLGLGLLTLFRLHRQTGNSGRFRRAFLVLLLAYGTFFYFLGRSVDNNLLNLLPYQLLVLLVAVDSGLPKAARQMAVVMLACLFGGVSLFGWASWHQTASAGRLIEVEPKKRIQMFQQNPDAERALAFIRDKFREPVVVLDYRNNLTVTRHPDVWNAFHGPANFFYLPSAMRREFLSNTARTLQRPGWVVVRKDTSAGSPTVVDPNKVQLSDPAGLLQDIYHVYRPTQGLDFGNYHAIRFAPR